MVVIRMSRRGARKRPFYHIVVTDNRKARDGRPIERIGFFNPLAKENEEGVRIDLDRIKYWLDVGAEMSDRVNSLVKSTNKQSKQKSVVV
jgi:small subunit ribosomal protein S16